MNAHNYKQYQNLLEALKTDPVLDPLNHLNLTRAYGQQGLLLPIVLHTNNELKQENEALRTKLKNCWCQTEVPPVELDTSLRMPDLDLKYESYIREADKPFGCLKNIQTELNTLPQGNTPIHHNTPEQQEDSLAGLDDILQEAIEKAKLFADTNNLNEAHMPEEANSSNNISPVADTPDINENNNPVYTNNNEKTSPPLLNNT